MARLAAQELLQLGAAEGPSPLHRQLLQVANPPDTLQSWQRKTLNLPAHVYLISFIMLLVIIMLLLFCHCYRMCRIALSVRTAQQLGELQGAAAGAADAAARKKTPQSIIDQLPVAKYSSLYSKFPWRQQQQQQQEASNGDGSQDQQQQPSGLLALASHLWPSSSAAAAQPGQQQQQQQQQPLSPRARGHSRTMSWEGFASRFQRQQQQQQPGQQHRHSFALEHFAAREAPVAAAAPVALQGLPVALPLELPSAAAAAAAAPAPAPAINQQAAPAATPAAAASGIQVVVEPYPAFPPSHTNHAGGGAKPHATTAAAAATFVAAAAGGKAWEMSSSAGGEVLCTICLEEFRAGEDIKLLPCQHYFHVDCINEWLQRDITCPLCKHELVDQEQLAVLLASEDPAAAAALAAAAAAAARSSGAAAQGAAGTGGAGDAAAAGAGDGAGPAAEPVRLTWRDYREIFDDVMQLWVHGRIRSLSVTRAMLEEQQQQRLQRRASPEQQQQQQGSTDVEMAAPSRV